MSRTWTPVPCDECQELFDEIKENGKRVGSVQRFYADGPTYAWADNMRLGGYTEEGDARLAVLRALDEGREKTLGRYGGPLIEDDRCA